MNIDMHVQNKLNNKIKKPDRRVNINDVDMDIHWKHLGSPQKPHYICHHIGHVFKLSVSEYNNQQFKA